MALSAGKAAEGIDAEVSAARETPPSSSRLSMPFRERLILSECGAAIGGFALGATQGGLVAGLRFRAENAHRLPETTTGWYFYHRSKNYNAMFGGIKEGLRLGGRTCVWVSAYVLAEEAVDQLRGGSRDFVSSVVASLALAGFVSAWSKQISI